MKTTAKRPGMFKAAIQKWLGVPFDLTNDEAWASVAGASGPAGVSVTAQSAMQVSAVWACVRLISETIATLPLGMYERGSAGKRPAPQHPLHFLIHDQPNSDSSASVYWEAMVAAMLLRGAGRSEKLIIGGRLVGLRFLNPDRLSWSRDSAGRKEWRYTEKDGRQRVIPRDRIWEVPGFTLDGESGVSVIAYGAHVFGGAIAAERAAARTFSNGMLQTVYYKVAAFLQPRQRDEFRRNVLGAVERGETPLLEGGTDVGTIGINPSDSQLLESRSFGVEEVARWFRVDSALIGHGQKDSNWGTGLEQKMIWFLTFTLAPWLKRIEQAIKKDLLQPGDRARFYPKYSVEGLLRADSAGRSAFYGAMVNNGILTRDEVRELEDREPMGGNAAVLTVQSAMLPLDALGQNDQQAQQVRASLRALLGIEQPATGE
ncbi:phage portal protein [Luteimonas sp BLCC-B24]|uniref:phage portal protein n=1 Tax=Luteimonas sp. BLCC-B24 TaxID=3025317 RepID=UPI00234CEB5B|nr:phage portal protein [Luteimonas sp. BLCC-B24]MDC7805535.1 phage portal protein [Luteimonas sp. BLCC-B24]